MSDELALEGEIREAINWLNERKEALGGGEDQGAGQMLDGDEGEQFYRRLLVGMDIDFSQFALFLAIAAQRFERRLIEGVPVSGAFNAIAADILIIGLRLGGRDG